MRARFPIVLCPLHMENSKHIDHFDRFALYCCAHLLGFFPLRRFNARLGCVCAIRSECCGAAAMLRNALDSKWIDLTSRLAFARSHYLGVSARPHPPTVSFVFSSARYSLPLRIRFGPECIERKWHIKHPTVKLVEIMHF